MRRALPATRAIRSCFAALPRPLAALGLSAALGSAASHARAAPPADEPVEPTRVVVRSETYLELYQRAFLPAGSGALLVSDTVVPITEYVALRADGLELPWRVGTAQAELSAWASVPIGDRERGALGDVRTASLTYGLEHGFVRVGRQHAVGGAARYARFDGLALGGRLPMGLGAEFYGGLTVLPRWNARLGYHHLGAATDTLFTNPEAFEQPNRLEYWLAGGRVSYAGRGAYAALSFHEQQQDAELGRRSLGLDARYEAFDFLSAGTRGVLDLDAERFQEARVYADITPIESLLVTTEYLHAEPALYLSRQSIFSVFSTSSYEELGGSVDYRPQRWIRLNARGYLEFFESDDVGARGELGLRVSPDPRERTLVQAVLGRVQDTDNGYHVFRASVQQQFLRELTGTIESYLYAYDEPIAGVSTASVFAGNVSWRARDDLSLLWSGSVARTPYASLDAQALVRLSYELSDGRSR